MTFSIYHLPSGNMIGDFDEEADALRAVMDEIEANDDAEKLALEESDDYGNRRIIATGADLLVLANERVGADSTLTASFNL